MLEWNTHELIATSSRNSRTCSQTRGRHSRELPRVPRCVKWQQINLLGVVEQAYDPRTPEAEAQGLCSRSAELQTELEAGLGLHTEILTEKTKAKQKITKALTAVPWGCSWDHRMRSCNAPTNRRKKCYHLQRDIERTRSWSQFQEKEFSLKQRWDPGHSRTLLPHGAMLGAQEKRPYTVI